MRRVLRCHLLRALLLCDDAVRAAGGALEEGSPSMKIALLVSDLRESRRFYAALGFRVAPRVNAAATWAR